MSGLESWGFVGLLVGVAVATDLLAVYVKRRRDRREAND